MRDRIVLFYPKTGFDIKHVSVDLPLSLLTVAAFIREEFEVALIDQRIDEDWRATLERELERDALCLGVSTMTCPQINFGLEACAIARDISPDIVTVWGDAGGHRVPPARRRRRARGGRAGRAQPRARAPPQLEGGARRPRRHLR